MIYFPREFAMFFLSFDSGERGVDVFEVIWQISGNGLLKITIILVEYE